MKKQSLLIIAIIAIFFVANAAFAQIATFPYSEGFEAAFAPIGNNVTFIPNWTGNIVADSSRIHRDNARPRSGAHALACLPTSTIKDTVVLSLNLTGKKQGNFAFYACSDSAHSRTGSRPAVVYIDASADGGATYTGRMQIGDSTTTFPRRPTLYKLYQFALPATTDNKASVKVRLIISRGAAGAGTVARFVMDDVSVTANTIVSTESEATNTLGFATYPNPTSGRIAARWMAKSAETTNATVSDILGRVCFTQQLPTNEGENIAELSLNLPKGVYFVRMSQAGNNGTQKIIIE